MERPNGIVSEEQRNWKLDRYKTHMGPNEGRLFGDADNGIVFIVEDNDRISVSEIKQGEKKEVDSVTFGELRDEGVYTRLLDEKAGTVISVSLRKRVGKKHGFNFVYPKGLANQAFSDQDGDART